MGDKERLKEIRNNAEATRREIDTDYRSRSEIDREWLLSHIDTLQRRVGDLLLDIRRREEDRMGRESLEVSIRRDMAKLRRQRDTLSRHRTLLYDATGRAIEHIVHGNAGCAWTILQDAQNQIDAEDKEAEA